MAQSLAQNTAGHGSPRPSSNPYAYQVGIFKRWDSPAPVMGGVEAHVHTLFSLSKNHPLKKLVEETKKGSSKWMKVDGPKNKDFQWQCGYAAFSVSQSNAEEVRPPQAVVSG